MLFKFKARAEGRALISAALIGSGIGACLGAAFLAGGMVRAVEAATPSATQVSLRGPLPAPGANLTLTPGGSAVVRAALPSPADPIRLAAAMNKHPPAEPFRGKAGLSDLECRTQAVYFEARGETARGQAAVAQVVLNRVRHPSFPKSVCGVVFQGSSRKTGCQFSFACNGALKARRESAAWENARKVATRALSGFVMADVGSATHFHTTYVRPKWGPQLSRVSQVGLHVFYRLRGGSHPRPAPEAADSVYARLDPAQDAAAQAASTDVMLISAPTPAEAKPVALEAPQPAKPAETSAITPADAAGQPASETSSAS